MNKVSLSLPTVYPEELARKGNEIYEKIKKKLEKENWGNFVAIEVESGEYFVGEKQDEVLQKAKERFPEKIFYLVRVGYPGAISLSTSHRPLSYGSIL